MWWTEKIFYKFEDQLRFRKRQKRLTRLYIYDITKRLMQIDEHPTSIECYNEFEVTREIDSSNSLRIYIILSNRGYLDTLRVDLNQTRTKSDAIYMPFQYGIVNPVDWCKFLVHFIDLERKLVEPELKHLIKLNNLEINTILLEAI